MTGVTLGSVHMNWKTLPGGTTDSFGVDWGLTKLDGWFDGWEGAGLVDQKMNADGAWVSQQYASPRVVHIEGTIRTSSWDATTQAWDRLLSQIPFRNLAAMSVTTGDGAIPEQTAMVRQHEKPLLPNDRRFGGRAEFSLSVIAPDPRKYATTTQTTNLVLPLLSGGIAPPLTPPLTVTGSSTVSQATLTNAGTVTTYPTLTITGPCPPARIVNLTTSEVLRVVDAVPSGQTLVIDTLNNSASVNGQFRRVLGSWWGLQPGANEVAFSADGYDAAASLSVSFRSAWK